MSGDNKTSGSGQAANVMPRGSRLLTTIGNANSFEKVTIHYWENKRANLRGRFSSAGDNTNPSELANLFDGGEV
jgi:hypothetical protein